jgi:nucleotide-binding universal stress UspA family protein
MKVLIPVRYPLTDNNRRAIERGIDLVNGHENPELLVFHLNELQSDQRIGRKTLREAVEAEFDGIDASYVVRDGFLVEEAIIEEAIRLEMDYIVLSTYRRNRWTQLFEAILGIDERPEQLIRERTGIELEVITESGSDTKTP